MSNTLYITVAPCARISFITDSLDTHSTMPQNGGGIGDTLAIRPDIALPLNIAPFSLLPLLGIHIEIASGVERL